MINPNVQTKVHVHSNTGSSNCFIHVPLFSKIRLLLVLIVIHIHNFRKLFKTKTNTNSFSRIKVSLEGVSFSDQLPLFTLALIKFEFCLYTYSESWIYFVQFEIFSGFGSWWNLVLFDRARLSLAVVFVFRFRSLHVYL